MSSDWDKIIQAIADAFTNARELTKNDFALVGPGEGE